MIDINKETILAVLVVAVSLYSAKKIIDNRNLPPVVSVHDRHNLPTEPAKQRYVALGKGEVQYARLALNEHGANKIFLVCTVKGSRIDPKRVEFAAECLQRRHPFLRCRVTRIGKNLVLEELDTLKLKVNVRSREGPESFRKVYYSEVEKVPLPVGDNAGSPHSVWLFQSEKPSPTGEEVSEIAIELAHFAFDGSGLSNLAHELLTYVLDSTAKLPEYGAWPVSQDFGLKQTIEAEMHWFFKVLWQIRLSIRVFWIAGTMEHHSVDRDDNFSVPDYSRLHSTACVCDTLSELETEAFLSKCKERKVSVTTAVAAAYLETLAEMRYKTIKRPLCPHLVLVGDSRKLSTPAAPATDLTPHVYAFPAYLPETQAWEEHESRERTWKIANDVKDFLKNYLSHPLRAAVYADLIGFWLSNQPAHSSVAPMLNVSSWSANSPVLREYGGTKVEDIELLQNFSYQSWFNVSMYTFIGKLHMSLLAPSPRFSEATVKNVSKKAGAKIRQMST